MTTDPRVAEIDALFTEGGEPGQILFELEHQWRSWLRSAAIKAMQGEQDALRYRGIISEYRYLWLICHENNPREPVTGELTRLGQLRGALFAAIDEAMRQNTASPPQAEKGSGK